MSNYLRRLADPESFRLAEEYRDQPEAVLEALRAVEDRRGSLSRAAIEGVAAALRLPAAQVYGVATFYSMLHVAEAPCDEQVARVCDGPVCWLKGASQARRRAGGPAGAGLAHRTLKLPGPMRPRPGGADRWGVGRELAGGGHRRLCQSAARRGAGDAGPRRPP